MWQLYKWNQLIMSSWGWYSAWCGICITWTTICNDWVTSVNGCSWDVCLDLLPSQSWCCGKFLTTDWTNASWWAVPPGGIQNDTTCTVDTLNSVWLWCSECYTCVPKVEWVEYHIY